MVLRTLHVDSSILCFLLLKEMYPFQQYVDHTFSPEQRQFKKYVH